MGANCVLPNKNLQCMLSYLSTTHRYDATAYAVEATAKRYTVDDLIVFYYSL